MKVRPDVVLWMYEYCMTWSLVAMKAKPDICTMDVLCDLVLGGHKGQA